MEVLPFCWILRCAGCYGWWIFSLLMFYLQWVFYPQTQIAQIIPQIRPSVEPLPMVAAAQMNKNNLTPNNQVKSKQTPHISLKPYILEQRNKQNRVAKVSYGVSLPTLASNVQN